MGGPRLTSRKEGADMELDQVLILASVLILIFFSLLILRTKIRFRAINEQYGKPYRAFVIEVVKIIGDIPQLRIGTTSLALHPLGAISLDTRVILYSQIESITIQGNISEESNDPKEKNENSIWIELTEKSTFVITAKKEIDEIEHELLMGWRKYYISGH